MKPDVHQGIVYLVGAGPGDPGLITLRGIECLRQADVVIYDRLANRTLLTYASKAELIDVGKRPGRHPLPQEEINALLVDRAREGTIVVRLKGGDPFVFGRGGEEALALVQAGISFEIVPGVTSAIAAPAYAGIPVIQRNMASNLTILTGPRSESKDIEPEWKRLARESDTLIILMGDNNLPVIVKQLVAGGRSPKTPVALVEQATCPSQKTTVGTLSNIVERAAGVKPPVVIIIGPVVQLRQTLRWFDNTDSRPLLGVCILNTRPSKKPIPTSVGQHSFERSISFHSLGDIFSQQLTNLGANVFNLPATKVVPAPFPGPLDKAIDDLVLRSAYNWVLFSSANAFIFFMDRLFAKGHDVRALSNVNLGAVGKETTNTLHLFGLTPDFVPTRHTGGSMAAEIENITGQRVLLPHSDATLLGTSVGVRIGLLSTLQERGAQVEAVVTYAVRPVEPETNALAALLGGRVDIATFFSPSALSGLAIMLSDVRQSQGIASSLTDVLAQLTVACIGPATAKAADSLGVRVDIIPEEHTIEGMCEALQKYLNKR